MRPPSAEKPGYGAVNGTAAQCHMKRRVKEYALLRPRYGFGSAFAHCRHRRGPYPDTGRQRLQETPAGCRAYQTGKCLFRLISGLSRSPTGCNLFVLPLSGTVGAKPSPRASGASAVMRSNPTSLHRPASGRSPRSRLHSYTFTKSSYLKHDFQCSGGPQRFGSQDKGSQED